MLGQPAATTFAIALSLHLQSRTTCLKAENVPLYWVLDSRQRLVTHTAEDDLTRNELMTYFDVIEGTAAYGWRKLFDARGARLAMTSDDIMAIGARLREIHGRAPHGPMAVVMPRVESESFSRLLGFIAAADRQTRVFQELEPARQWILSA